MGQQPIYQCPRAMPSSCIQGSAIGNATSASSSACSSRISGMFSFRSTRDDRETQFLLHYRRQWSTCGLGITLRVSEQRCVQTSTAPCIESAGNDFKFCWIHSRLLQPSYTT